LIISHSNQYIIAWNALDKIICLFSSHIYLYMGAFLSKDLEKNVRGLMTQGFQKLDLVTREEFDLQTQVLAKTRAKLEELEAKVSALEKK
jgi:BMFP domain-containing protein YqiC